MIVRLAVDGGAADAVERAVEAGMLDVRCWRSMDTGIVSYE
jgi:hypothetical protein